ncbi:MAG: hypothetical protein BWK80_12845 [Desulfobacteraceae bacterium IS3]|nr:MAG: hypothetical protein BWK80_12845 [Desulfobacteraceae bacterium IS3]
MSQTQSFSCPQSRFQKLINSTQSWLSGENFRCQKLQTEDGAIVVQIEKMGGWRKFVGMSTALNIIFRQVDNAVNVEIGAGRWADKAIVGGIAMFVTLGVLLIPASIGTWQQAKMPERIFTYIAEYLSKPE